VHPSNFSTMRRARPGEFVGGLPTNADLPSGRRPGPGRRVMGSTPTHQHLTQRALGTQGLCLAPHFTLYAPPLGGRRAARTCVGQAPGPTPAGLPNTFRHKQNLKARAPWPPIPCRRAIPACHRLHPSSGAPVASAEGPALLSCPECSSGTQGRPVTWQQRRRPPVNSRRPLARDKRHGRLCPCRRRCWLPLTRGRFVWDGHNSVPGIASTQVQCLAV
jgi:hypothetical protein